MSEASVLSLGGDFGAAVGLLVGAVFGGDLTLVDLFFYAPCYLELLGRIIGFF